MPFKDRTEAGRRLVPALATYRNTDSLILALPRGGLPVAVPIAEGLNGRLDLLLVRKIGVPFDPELAMGAVLEGEPPIVMRNEETIRLAGISTQLFEATKERELLEIDRRRRVYRRGKPMTDIKGKIVILVDDGIATGSTARAALTGIRRLQPDTIVLAVPVAPRSLFATLAEETDEFVWLEELGQSGAISSHYDRFEQLCDQDVVNLLERSTRHGVG